MSNPYTGSVAAALRKCQLLLDSHESSTRGENTREGSSAAPSAPLALTQFAELEGALLQLWRAYRAFLAEQAHQLGLAAEPESAGQLLRMAEAGHKRSAELGELVSLAENPDSWFAELERAWQGLWRFSAQGGGAQSAQAANASRAAVAGVIPVVQVSEPTAPPLSAEQLNRWYRCLSELIARQRAQGLEW